MLPPIAHFTTPLARAALAISFVVFTTASRAEIAVKSGEKIAFLGDSITQQGWGSPTGYVRLVMAGLEANGIKAEAVPAGISGHKSNQMLERLERDVLSKKPQWMTLSCGVNDVWHGVKGVPLDEAQASAGTFETKPGEADRGTYKKNIGAIVDKATAAGVQVVMLTATVIREDLATPENTKLAPYNDFLRQLAKEKKLRLADLNAIFQEHIKTANKPGQKVFTRDGVHMNREGDKLMAAGVLQALGADAKELKKAESAWVPLEEKAVTAEKEAAEKKAAAAAEAKAKAAAQPATPAAK